MDVFQGMIDWTFCNGPVVVATCNFHPTSLHNFRCTSHASHLLQHKSKQFEVSSRNRRYLSQPWLTPNSDLTFAESHKITYRVPNTSISLIIALNPNVQIQRMDLTWILLFSRRIIEAKPTSQRSQRLQPEDDPFNSTTTLHVGPYWNCELTVSSSPSGTPAYHLTYQDFLDTVQGLSEFYFGDIDPHQLAPTYDSMEFEIQRSGQLGSIGIGKVATRRE